MNRVFVSPLMLTLIYLIVVFGGSFLVAAFVQSSYALPLASGWVVATFSLYVVYATFVRTTARATERQGRAGGSLQFLIALAIASSVVFIGIIVPAFGVEMSRGWSNLLSFVGYGTFVAVLWTAASDLCWSERRGHSVFGTFLLILFMPLGVWYIDARLKLVGMIPE